MLRLLYWSRGGGGGYCDTGSVRSWVGQSYGRTGQEGQVGPAGRRASRATRGELPPVHMEAVRAWANI